MVSLCEQCRNYDAETTGNAREDCRKAGVTVRSVWCRFSDRPEDVRWETCKGSVPWG